MGSDTITAHDLQRGRSSDKERLSTVAEAMVGWRSACGMQESDLLQGTFVISYLFILQILR